MLESPMEFETYLLDWDGCMAQTLQVWMNTYLSVYKQHGINVTQEEIVEKSWGNLALGPKNFGIIENEQCWSEIVKKVREGVAQVPLYRGVLETLLTLRQNNKKIAIVTSSERSIIMPALAFHGIDVLIDALVTEEDVSHPKPDPEIVLFALKKLEAKKETSMIIGDTGKDIQAGQAAGISTILMCHAENKPFYDFTKYIALRPNYIITTFADLVKI